MASDDAADAMKASIQALVTAYNNIQSSAKTLTQFDTKAGTKGALNGDGVLRGIQTSLRSVLNTPEGGMPANAPKMLAAIGGRNTVLYCGHGAGQALLL